jgi:ElaA protein
MTQINNNALVWKLRSFHDITVNELYDSLQLRQMVFVKEQNCAYVDADGTDKLSHHLLGLQTGLLVAYARLIPPGALYEEASIGRVVTSPQVRRLGFGKLLFEKSIEECVKNFGKQTIKIMAQSYLLKFYESYGFIKTGNEFLEDNIAHYYMLKSF